MKKSNINFLRILQTPATMGFIAFSALSLSGCLGSGDNDDVAVDGGGDTTGVNAFNFTADNSITAAQLAANTMSFFPAFTQVGHAIISELVVSDPNNSPFDLGICANAGSSILSWTDTDSSGDLTAGDTTSLAFTDCDIDGIANGTVNFAVTSADLDQTPPDSIAMNVTTNLSIFDDPDILTFSASFKAEMSTEYNNDVFTLAYTADDPSGEKIAVSENGALLYQFGCFNVSETYSPSTLGTYSLATAGVLNAANNIMSLAGGPAVNFSNDMMESGTKRLLSLAVPECATVGVANGVGDSDGSYLDIEATGGGNITLRTYNDANAEVFSTVTTWNSLLLN